MTDDPMAESLIEQVRAEGRRRFREAEAKRLLAAAGIDIPDYEVVSSPEAAVKAADRIGYPVVAKVSAPGIQHKSEWADGAGVALDLRDEVAIREAASRIFDAAESTDSVVQVLVEASADTERGVEVIVGGVRDDSFGPVVLFGLGGTFTEVLKDTSFRLAPISTVEAHAMLDDIEATELLDGYRERPPVDRDALAETIQAVGDLLVEQEALQELEINPLLAAGDREPVTLDALVMLE